MDKDEWHSTLQQASVPLRKLGDKMYPVGFASGGLVDYQGERLILTVQHATGDTGNGAIEVKFVPGTGTQLYKIGSMMFLKIGNLVAGTIEDVDFSYALVPTDLQPVQQEVSSKGQIMSEVPKLILSLDPTLNPDHANEYGFAGLVKPTIYHEYFFSQLKVHAGLRFIRSQGNYHVFKLPGKHPGHEEFVGCSGAPILDRQGRLVSLVCGGRMDTDEILGLRLSYFRSALDIEVGNVG